MADQTLNVHILFEGYSNILQDGSMLANCTCTLVTDHRPQSKTNVIVDTMTSWDGPKLQEALKSHNIDCKDVNYVVCTHGHSDHVGCNYLFPNAVHIVGFSVSRKDKYFDHDFKSGLEYIISEEIKVIPTPGHTLQDVSVIVETNNLGIVAITGDLFEKEEDCDNDSIWKSAGSDSEQLQIINRKKILKMADYIIPGHGPLFKVKK